ncbi:MAG: hypothetical protein AAF502_07540 [Bacteroidota bacterium]
MLLRVFGIILLLGWTVISTSAQTTWTKGYIVTNPGDTIRGKIKETTPGQRSVQIVFRGNNSDEKIRYKPFNIKGFHVNERYYESKIYDVDVDLNYGFGVFMERMNKGIVQIYHYWNTDKDRGFTQTFIENDGDYLLEVNFMRFKWQMAKYFEEYPELQARIKDGEFKKKDLMKIVDEYNRWKENEW